VVVDGVLYTEHRYSPFGKGRPEQSVCSCLSTCLAKSFPTDSFRTPEFFPDAPCIEIPWLMLLLLLLLLLMMMMI